MAAPRVEIPIVVLSEESPTSPVAGATVFVKNRVGGALSTVYSDSGATNNTIVQPLTTNGAGMITGWLPRGAYNVEITVSGKIPYVEYLDIAPAADKGVDTAWLADEAVTGTKVAAAIKDAASGTASLRTLGTGAAQAAAGNDARLSDERTPKNTSVTTAKIVDANVTGEKIANGAITSSKINIDVGSRHQPYWWDQYETGTGVSITLLMIKEIFYYTYVVIPGNATITGISVAPPQWNTTARSGIYDANGLLLARSTSNVTLGSETLSENRIPFSAPVAVGPGRYHIGVMSMTGGNSSRAGIRGQPWSNMSTSPSAPGLIPALTPSAALLGEPFVYPLISTY